MEKSWIYRYYGLFKLSRKFFRELWKDAPMLAAIFVFCPTITVFALWLGDSVFYLTLVFDVMFAYVGVRILMDFFREKGEK